MNRFLLEQIVELAAAGETRKAVAEKLGLHYLTVVKTALANGIQFKHALAQGVNERSETMVALYTDGFTLEDIGKQFKLTRERVRQIITKHYGKIADRGGAKVRAARTAERFRARRDAIYLKKYGISFTEWQNLAKLGREMVASGKGRGQSPTYAFCQQRSSAHQRGIGWGLTLGEWWTIWRESGHWRERGRGQGYVMCRKGDVGPYEVGNVFIAPARENSSDRKAKKSGLPIGVSYVKKGGYEAFVAHRCLNGKKMRLGSFKTPELAYAAYLRAAPKQGVAA